MPSLFEPRWYSDEGFFTTVSWATSRGVPLYSGVFDNSPPVIFWLYRLALTFGTGNQHFLVQLMATVAATTAALLTFEISRRLLPQWHAALAGSLTGLALSLPVLDGDLFNVELAALPFFVGALLAAFSKRGAIVFASGALLGVAIATRPSFALDGCVLALPLLAQPDRGRRFLLAVCGLSLTGAVVAGALAAQGSLAAYLTLVVPADRAYLLWSNGGTLVPLLARLLVLAAAAAFAVRSATTPAGRLAALWLPLAVAGASLTPRELTHYCHEAIPPLAFTAGMAIQRFRLRWLAAVPAAIAVLAGAEAVLIIPAQETALLTRTGAPRPLLHNFAYEGIPAYYSNWFLFVLGREPAAAYADTFPGGTAVGRAEIAFLKAQPGSADSRLIVLGDRPWLYVEAGILPAGRYIATNSAFWRVPSAPGDMRAAIRSRCADFVVSETGRDDWRAPLDAGSYTELPGAPLPTYRSAGRGVGCGS